MTDLATAKSNLTNADLINLECILLATTRLGNKDLFENLLVNYGLWGRGGVLPKALQSYGNASKRYGISESMMLYIEAHINALRAKTIEAPDLYCAFRLRYLSGPKAPVNKAKYKAALKTRHKLYSLRGLGRDSASFIKRLRLAILDDLGMQDD